MPDPEEVRIRIWKTGQGRYLVFANGPTAAADIVHLPQPADHYRCRFDELIDLDLGGASTAEPDSIRQRMVELGRELFDIFLPQPIWDRLLEARAGAQQRRGEFRLRFYAPELNEIPFQCLHPPNDDPMSFLVMEGVSVVHSGVGQPVPRERLPRGDESREDLRVLVLVASPTNVAVIDPKLQIRALREAAPPHIREPITHLERPREKSNREHLADALRKIDARRCALLVVAHGEIDRERNQMCILLESPDGDIDRVPATEFASIVASVPELRFVMLNICVGAQSIPGEPFAGAAQALLAQGIPAVLAMQTKVSIRGATACAPKVFEAIWGNGTIDNGVLGGRSKMSELGGASSVEWATPILFLHEDCGAGWLFKVTAVTARGQAEPVDVHLAGWEAHQRVEHPPDGKIIDEDVLAAARFERMCRNWSEVWRLATIGIDARTRAGLDLQPFPDLRREAAIELALSSCAQACKALAQGDPEQALEILNGCGPDCAAFVAVLRGEVDAARSSLLIDSADQAFASGTWVLAMEKYAELSVLGDHRRAVTRYAYAAGRRAEVQGDWQAASTAFAAVISAGPDPDCSDAAGRRAYAMGRCLEQQRDWSGATTAYGSIDALEGSDVRARQAYAGARQLEEHDRLHEAQLAYRELGDHDDAPLRLARIMARLATSLSDWLAVSSHLATSPRAGGDELLRQAVWRQLVAYGDQAEREGRWQDALEAFAALPEGYPEVGRRVAYIHACSEQEAGRWDEAADGFAAAGDYSDALARLSYVRGRRAAARRDWDIAEAEFRAAPIDLLDTKHQLWVAAGHAADVKGNWDAVIAGFGDLAIGDDGGAVGVLRAYARARIHAASDAWRRAIEDLIGIDDDARDGDVGRLRRYATARIAEQNHQWAEACEWYGRIEADQFDVGLRHQYALARAAEITTDWPKALALYDPLADDYGDVRDRRRYATGRVAELGSAWADAGAAYAEIAPSFEDVAARLAYARGKQQQSVGDWHGVMTAVASLGDSYRDVASLRAYAQARISEQLRQWDRAVTLYQRCLPVFDATQRSLQVCGRKREEDGQWSLALAAYNQLPDSFEDTARRRQRVSALLEALPWADGLATAGLVPDPRASGADLYSCLKAVGISPDSSASEIKEASYILQERQAFTPERRAAWDQLRLPHRRLCLDAMLYRLHDRDALRTALAEIEPQPRAQLVRRVCEHCPEDAPLFHLLDGRPEMAVEAWASRLRTDPGRVDMVHALAVERLQAARYLDANGVYERADSAWESAIAYWGRLLSEDVYWTSWANDRARHYGEAVPLTLIARLRADLGGYLLHDLHQQMEACLQLGRRERAERYRQLATAVEVELEGARLLKDLNGIPLDGHTNARLFCGPLYLRQTHASRALATLVAQLESSPGQDDGSFRTLADDVLSSRFETSSYDIYRLRCLFSEFGHASLLLEHQQPELALNAVPAIRLARMSDLPEDCAEFAGHANPSEHVDQCPKCVEFGLRNPAYLLRSHRIVQLFTDAVELATRAQLSLAQNALTGSVDSSNREALIWWQAAIDGSRRAGMQVRTKRAIARVVLGRCDALDGSSGPTRGARLTEGLVLIDQVRKLLGPSQSAELDGKEAELLADRGIWYGYGCRQYEEPDSARAIPDLRRALQLNPDSIHARDNLARALIYSAANASRAGGRASAFSNLYEAITILHEGLQRTAGHRRLRAILNEALRELEEWLWMDLSADQLLTAIKAEPSAEASEPDCDELLLRATACLADDSPGSALELAIAATRKDPNSSPARTLLIAALQRRSEAVP